MYIYAACQIVNIYSYRDYVWVGSYVVSLYFPYRPALAQASHLSTSNIFTPRDCARGKVIGSVVVVVDTNFSYISTYLNIKASALLVSAT